MNEIKTCEEYVIHQLNKSEKELDLANLKIGGLEKEIETLKEKLNQYREDIKFIQSFRFFSLKYHTPSLKWHLTANDNGVVFTNLDDPTARRLIDILGLEDMAMSEEARKHLASYSELVRMENAKENK